MSEPSDSLQELFDGFDDSQFKDTIYDEYEDVLKNEVLAGKELDIPEMGTSVRKYDHGQADDTVVTEYGVRIVFDREEVSLDALEDGGQIREEIADLARNLIDVPVEYIDISQITEDGYVLWVVVEANEL